MPKVAGQLLWSRRQITVTYVAPPPGQPDSNLIDTGLTQKSLAFGTDPPMDGADPTVGDQDGTPSRIQVIPLAPLANWQYVTHDEPYVANGRVYVQFHMNGERIQTINVLFWNPHSMLGPGDADTYNEYLPD